MRKNVIFIAPPFAGKGTQSEFLVEKYHMAHISTGDLLRGEVAKGSEQGKYILQIQTSGGLVDDDIVFALLEKRLKEPDCENGYILDGFPRTINQAERYEIIASTLGEHQDYIIYLEIDRELAKERVVGRVSCPSCGVIYNTYTDKLENDECPNCKVKLIKRPDDTEEVFASRFDTYIEKTQPLIEYYKQRGVLHIVDSGINKQHTFSQIEDILNGK